MKQKRMSRATKGIIFKQCAEKRCNIGAPVSICLISRHVGAVPGQPVTPCASEIALSEYF